jgi:hypothetical protein
VGTRLASQSWQTRLLPMSVSIHQEEGQGTMSTT